MKTRNILSRILVLMAIALAAGCGGGSGTGNSAGPSLKGGAIQGKELVLTGTLTTIAGTAGLAGSSDGLGAAARFNAPWAMTTDGTNLYILDTNSFTIRKVVIATGAVTTLAGSAGISGSADGTGAAARFSEFYGITTDGTNLYVADSANSTIRKVVIATGAVTTLAGTAGSKGSADGVGAAARFMDPYGITTDGINLFVADDNDSTIRKIVIATGEVTTLAGAHGIAGSTDGIGTAARLDMPLCIVTDGTNLFVTDGATIRKVVIATGAVTTVAGTAGVWGDADGIGAAASFYEDSGITTDGINLYVTDRKKTAIVPTIRKIVIATGEVSTLSVSGSLGTLWSTGGITTDGSSLYVSQDNNIITRLR